MKENKSLKRLIIFLCLVIVFFWITTYKPLRNKPRRNLLMLTYSSPPRHIYVDNQEIQEEIIKLINKAPKKFIAIELAHFGYFMYVKVDDVDTVYITKDYIIKNHRKFMVNESLLNNLQDIFNDLVN